MKKLLYLLISLTLVSCIHHPDEKNKAREKTNDYKLEQLATGFNFTEGPAVDAEGNVYFTDINQEMILVWTVNEQLDTFRLKSGRANGLFFDKNQNLLACEGGTGRISSTSPEGKYTVIAAEFEGNRFNQPNDLWPDKKGGVYFTDPKYGDDEDNLPQDGMNVYYIHPNHTKVTRVSADFKKPNGVLGTPDGKTLYVTDQFAGKTFKYDIQEDGNLKNKTLFVDLGCDGMTIDKQGNIYFTRNGANVVDIYSPNGKLLETIPVPEKPTNVCFGGKERNQLYITARTSLYRIQRDTQGVN